MRSADHRMCGFDGTYLEGIMASGHVSCVNR